MKKIKEKTIQEWIPIQTITKDGIIKLKNNKYIKIIKIIPINYNLKSDLEKRAILNSYKIFLKTCNFNIQIIIQSSKENLNKNIKKIKENIQKENIKALDKGMNNLFKHIKNLRDVYGLNVIVAINKYVQDSSKEIEYLKEKLKEKNIDLSTSMGAWWKRSRRFSTKGSKFS